MSADVHHFRSRRTLDLPAPHNIEAEQALLGAILINNDAWNRVSDFLKPEHFSEEIHKRVYYVASQLIRAGKVATPITLKTFLGDADLGGLTIPQYLARLAAEATAILNARDYGCTIYDLAVRRDLVEAAERIKAVACDAYPDRTCAEIASDAMLELQVIAGTASGNTGRHASVFADEMMQLIDDVRSGRVESQTVTTGYPDLDKAMNGFNPEELVVIAGRPGMGKTGVLNSFARRTARAGNGVLEFPLEVGHKQLVARHLADAAYHGPTSASFRDIGNRAGQLSEANVVSLRDAHRKFRELPIEIDTRSRVTLAQIAAKVAQTKRAMATRGETLRVCMLDHLDYIIASDRYAGNRTQEIGEICIGLKAIARSENICIVLFCQLNRDVEKRPVKDRRPSLADLRNSGDIEQVADVVMFVYRPEYYLTRSAEYRAGDAEAVEAAMSAKGKLELVLAKVRAGPTPIIQLWCDMAASSISSFERGRT